MNKMLKVVVFAVLILHMINAFYYEMSSGCPTFYGYVRCQNGTIQGQGKIVLRKLIEGRNDAFLASQLLKNNIFHISGCANSNETTTEMYLEFFDVCNPKEYHVSGNLDDNGFTVYTIDGSDIEAKAFNE